MDLLRFLPDGVCACHQTCYGSSQISSPAVCHDILNVSVRVLGQALLERRSSCIVLTGDVEIDSNVCGRGVPIAI